MPRVSILVVDDSAVQLDSFRRSLAGSEYQLVTVNSTAEALRAIDAAPPGGFDIAVIDYHLGGTETGDGCLQQLRAVVPDQTTRFYLYTTDPEAFKRHRDMGFDGVLMLKGKAAVRQQIDAIARSITRSRAS